MKEGQWINGLWYPKEDIKVFKMEDKHEKRKKKRGRPKKNTQKSIKTTKKVDNLAEACEK